MFQINKDRFKQTFLKKLNEQGYECSMHEGEVVMKYCDETFWVFVTNSLHSERMVRVAVQNRYTMDEIDELSWEWKKAIVSKMNDEYHLIASVDYSDCFVATYQCDVHSVKELLKGLVGVLNHLREVEITARRDFNYLLGQYGKSQSGNSEKHIGFRQTPQAESNEQHFAAQHNDSPCE